MELISFLVSLKVGFPAVNPISVEITFAKPLGSVLVWPCKRGGARARQFEKDNLTKKLLRVIQRFIITYV